MKLLLIVLLFTAGIALPQQKYFVFFTDKDYSRDAELTPDMEIYQEVLKTLSGKTIKRRSSVMGDIIIRYEDLPVRQKYVNHLQSEGLTIVHTINWLNAVSLYAGEEQIRQIESLPYVSKTAPVKTLISANRPGTEQLLETIFNSGSPGRDSSIDYGNSYIQLAMSNVPEVHAKGITGEGVIIGMLDSGFDWEEHEALKDANIIGEYDFIFQDSVTANQEEDVRGQDSHGTYCFSIVGGFQNGVLIGAAYNAGFILAKTEDTRSETNVEEDYYAAALEWMEKIGVDITTSSLGYTTFDDSTQNYSYEKLDGMTTICSRAASYAFERGIITVTAGGNEGNDIWKYISAPADAINILSVAAVDKRYEPAPFTSYGPTVDGRVSPLISTLGVAVLGATSGTSGGYNFSNGTSAAAPIAAGIAGLLLSAHPHLNNIQIRHSLIQSAYDPDNPDERRGYGLLNAKDAIEYPNIEEAEDMILLHKTILEDDIEPETVKIHFEKTDEPVNTFSMTPSEEFDFTFPLMDFDREEPLQFYFTYQHNGLLKRVPGAEEQHYSYEYGTDTVSFIGERTPYEFRLHKNYPDPFDLVTRFSFWSHDTVSIDLRIVDENDSTVLSMYKGPLKKGISGFIWDGSTDVRDQKTAPGTYFIRLVANDIVFEEKITYQPQK